MKIKTIRYVSLFLLISWMGVIFAFSAQKGSDSGEMSRSVAIKVAEVIYPDYESLDENSKIEVINKFSMPVRKMAHFAEFFVLGTLSFIFFSTFGKLSFGLRLLLPLILGVLYAVSDEIHQLFVSGRACKLADVLIDFAGALLAVVIGCLITRKTAGEGNE